MMRGGDGMRRGFSLGIAMALLVWTGCCRGGKVPAPEERYGLEYRAPVLSGAVPLSGAVRVVRFGSDEALKTTQMVYRPEAFRRETDPYNRWTVLPESLVTDFLLRDFRRAGPFRAVFAEGDPQSCRFLVQGYLEEFEETDRPNGRAASLAATVTLLDLSRKDFPERILFQKEYRFEEPLPGEMARETARAMSRAVESFSSQLVREVYDAAGRREREETPAR